MIITIESGGWNIQSAPFIIVDDQKANIRGRNILPQICARLIQKNTKTKCVNRTQARAIRSGNQNVQIDNLLAQLS